MKNSTLFPEIQSAEQIARYQAIYKILDGYREGTVTMEQVMAIPKDELEEAREWVSEASFRLLEQDIPEYGEGDVE